MVMVSAEAGIWRAQISEDTGEKARGWSFQHR